MDPHVAVAFGAGHDAAGAVRAASEAGCDACGGQDDYGVFGHGFWVTDWILRPIQATQGTAKLLPMALYRRPSLAGLPR